MRKIIALILTLALLSGCAAKVSGTDLQNKSPNTPKQGPLTLAKYDKLIEGMTYEAATAIIGEYGELTDMDTQEGTPNHKEMYYYWGTGELLAHAMITFKGGKLIRKVQEGLE